MWMFTCGIYVGLSIENNVLADIGLSFYAIIGLVSQLISSVCRLIPELCLLYLFMSLFFVPFQHPMLLP